MKAFALVFAASAAMSLAQADIKPSWRCDNSLGGIYDASGSLLTTTVSIDHVDYQLRYRTADGSGPYDRSAVTRTYRVRISIVFSSADWQNFRSGALGVKVINYAASDAAALEQFVGSTGDGLSTVTVHTSTTGAAPSSVAFADVNPKQILLSGLTVDSKDKTGRTGYVEFDSPATSGRSEIWSTAIPNGRTGTWFPALWLFPQWGQPGAFNRDPVVPYPVEPVSP